MDPPVLVIWTLIFSCTITVCDGSAGDEDPIFRSCVEHCGQTGCVNTVCFSNCQRTDEVSHFNLSSLISDWGWDCASECEYQCMMLRESERLQEGLLPIQYHGKWPFERLFNLQEPASVAFSVANLGMHFEGWLSFLNLIYYKLPQKYQGIRSPYYEYAELWIVYGLLSMNSWFWSAIFHSRDVWITERMDYSSAVALIGYTLIVAIIRTLGLRTEATRVMVASPIVAFVSTHILYLNFYNFDYGLNMKICVAMGIIQIVLWTFWGAFTNHPRRFTLWFVVLSGASAMLLEVYDFPPFWGLFDAHSIWHAVTVPLTFIWWSFIKEDALFRTTQLTNMTQSVEGPKKVH